MPQCRRLIGADFADFCGILGKIVTGEGSPFTADVDVLVLMTACSFVWHACASLVQTLYGLRRPYNL